MTTQALVASRDTMEVTQEQMALARTTVAKGLDDDQFALYVYNCKRQGIHPLDGLVVPIVRNDSESGGKRLTFVSTVDLLRSRAAETNEYAGSDDSVFQYAQGQPLPTEATVTVWRFVMGEKCAFTATARWNEYYPGEKQGFMWRSKPHVMLGKCAEALALRKAFPKQLAGLYISEELQREVAPSRPTKKQAPVGDVMCNECRAVNGHLPSCPHRKQPPAAAQPVQEAKQEPQTAPTTPQTVETPQKPANERMVLLVKTIQERKKTAKDGKVQTYLVLSVIDNKNIEFDMYVWDKVLHEKAATLGSKTCLLEFSQKKGQNNRTYCSLEAILEVAGEQAEPEAEEF